MFVHHEAMESREIQTVRRSEVMLADIPEDLGDPTVEKASGVVRLPFHLDGSTPEGDHNLDDPPPVLRVRQGDTRGSR